MEKYCIFCGRTLVAGGCANPQCPVNETNTQRVSGNASSPRPISLRERRRQMCDRDTLQTVEEESVPPKIDIVPNEPDCERRDSCDFRRSGDRDTHGRFAPCSEGMHERLPPLSQEEEAAGLLLRFLFFIRDYAERPGKIVALTARKQDVGIGIVLMIFSVMVSALGTLLFGILHLEDFFVRWILCGISTPILAYSMSFLYGCLFARFSPPGKQRVRRGERTPPGEVFATVSAASVMPNVLLVLSGLFAPMDKNFGTFQFFALLITLCWLVCLIVSLFTVYGGDCSMGGLLLTMAFVTVTFLTMRALWVWYLTGEWRFLLYIPLSVFLT